MPSPYYLSMSLPAFSLKNAWLQVIITSRMEMDCKEKTPVLSKNDQNRWWFVLPLIVSFNIFLLEVQVLKKNDVWE